MQHIKQEVDTFMKAYEDATNTHDFNNVKPLLAEDLIYWFSDGTYTSIETLEQAFIDTWNKIQNEIYSLTDLEWISLDEYSAVCTYTFNWEGIVDGIEKKGKGRGTNVLVKREGKWLMLHEHLST